ncbi:MAG: tetratricopeptide repeat protein [Phycisphaerae bacterium]|nr:tetratricopeptide repeat protein [Phycisphaerae bacterium]
MNIKLYHEIVYCIIGLCVSGGGALWGQLPEPMGGHADPVASDCLKTVPEVVRSRSVDVGYQIPENIKKTIVSIELWYAQMDGGWQFYGFDQDLRPPVRFESPCEGNYKFLIVVVDQWGRRSCGNTTEGSSGRRIVIPPDAKGHLEVFIDYTSPHIFMQCSEAFVNKPEDRSIKIRWVGFDSHLTDLPVNFFWAESDNIGKSAEMLDWHKISNSHPADGRYTWRLPKTISGSVMLKAEISDKAGNLDVKYSKLFYAGKKSERLASETINTTGQVAKRDGKIEGQRTEVFADPAARPAGTLKKASAFELTGPTMLELTAGRLARPTALPERSQKEALDSNSEVVQKTLAMGKNFQRGWFYCERKEWRQARKSFEKALEIDPKMHSARLELAYTCFELGDYIQAVTYFEEYLNEKPSHQTAQIGLARAKNALEQNGQISQIASVKSIVKH